MATQAALLKKDPLRSFRFKVTIGGAGNGDTYKFGEAGFMSVSGLSMTTEVIPYREGGMNTTSRKMPGQTDFSPVNFSQGLMVGDPAMMLWMNDLFDAQQGSGGAKMSDFRVNVDIFLLAHPWPGPNPIPLAGWRLLNAWPTSVAFSDMDAGANSISITQMSLVHEGFYFKLATSVDGAGVSL